MKDYFKKSKSFLALVLAVLIAFTMTPVQGVQAATLKASATVKATAAITASGIITNSATKKVVSKATVSLMQGTKVVSKTTTDTKGKYTLTGLKANTSYTIKVAATGYATYTFAAFKTTKSVTKSKAIVPVFTVSGTIKGTKDAPLKDASVTLYQGTKKIGTVVKTDAKGNYKLANVPYGTGYTVKVVKSGYTTKTFAKFDVKKVVTGKSVTLKATAPVVEEITKVEVAPTTIAFTTGDTNTTTAKEIKATITPATITNPQLKWSVSSDKFALYADATATTPITTAATTATTVYIRPLSTLAATDTAVVTVESATNATIKATVNVTVATAKTNIDKVTYNPIAVPVIGATPAATYTPATSDTTLYTAGAIAWNGTPATFVADTAYTATVVLTANATHKFKTGFALTDVTGLTIAAPITAATAVPSEDGATLTITVTYAKTSAVPTVSSVMAINSAGAKVALEGANVGPNADIEINFSEAVNPETVNRNSVKLYLGTILVVINDIKISKDNVSAVVSHATLDDNADYKLVISDEVKTVKGTAFTIKEVLFKTNSQFVMKTLQVGSLPNVKNMSDVGNAELVLNNDFILSFNHSIDPSSIRQDNIKLERIITAGVPMTVSDIIPVTSSVVGTAIDTSKKLNINIDTSTTYSANNDVIKLTVDGLKDISGIELGKVQIQLSVDQLGLTAAAVGPNGGALSNTNYYYGITTLQKPDGTILPGFKTVVNFTVPVDPSTVTNNTVKLQKIGTNDTYTDVAVTLTLNNQNTSVTVMPTADLERNVEYRLFTTLDIKSMYDKKVTNIMNTKFKTTDSVGPTVISSNPVSGTINIKTDEKFELTVNFDKAIGYGDLDPNTAPVGAGAGTATFATASTGANANKHIAAYNASTSTYITPAVAFVDGSDNKSVKLTFAANSLTKNNTYVVKFSGAEGSQDSAKKVIEDAFGNVMAKDYQIQFTTEGVDSTAPVVSKITVKDVSEGTAVVTGTTNLDVKAALNIEFNEKLSNIGTVVVEQYKPTTGTWVTGTVAVGTAYNTSGNKHTYRDSYDYITIPANTFVTDTKYRLTINGQKDAVLNQQSNEYKVEFAFGEGPIVVKTQNTATKALAPGFVSTATTVVTASGGVAAAGIVADGTTKSTVAFKLDNGKYHVSKVTASTDTLTLATPLTGAMAAGNAIVKVPTVGAFQTGVQKDDTIIAVLQTKNPSSLEFRVDTDSITDTTVYIQEVVSGTKVASTVKATQIEITTTGVISDAVVEIMPSAKLKADTTYKIVFDGVKDRIGNVRKLDSYSFKTGSDPVVPAVTFTNMADEDLFQSYNPDTAIELTFSADPTGADLTGSYKLFVDTGVIGTYEAETLVPVNPVVDGAKVTLYPDAILTPNATFTLLVDDTAITVDGKTLSTNTALDNKLIFKTKNSASDTAAGSLGINTAKYNATTKILKLTFDRPVTVATINTLAEAEAQLTLTGGILKLKGDPIVDGLTVTMLIDTTTATIAPGTTTIASTATTTYDTTASPAAFGTVAVGITAE